MGNRSTKHIGTAENDARNDVRNDARNDRVAFYNRHYYKILTYLAIRELIIEILAIKLVIWIKKQVQ